MGTRTKFNLKSDGPKVCADHVLRALAYTAGCHGVYVDWRWDLRVIPDRSVKQQQRPDSELVGRYKKGITEREMVADLTQCLRDA